MKSNLTFGLSVVLFVLVLGLQAQHPVFRHYTVDEGLPSNEVYHLFQDSKGFIWIATNMGVSRFDGISFRNFDKQDGLPENTVFEVYEDYKGRIWFVGFPCKLSYYEDGRIIEYRHSNKLLSIVGKSQIPVKGSFEVLEDESLYISFLTKGLYQVLPNGNVKNLMVNKENVGLKLLSLNDKVLVSQNAGKFNRTLVEISVPGIRKTFSFPLSKNYSYSNVYFCMSGHELYIARNEYLAMLHNDNSIEFKNMKNRVIYLKKDKELNLWVCTDKSGVFCFQNGQIDKAPILNYLKNHSISSVLFDEEGGKWFSTLENGIFYLPSSSFYTYSVEDGLTNSKINAIAIFQNNLVIGTHDPFINYLKDGKVSSVKISSTINSTIFNIYNHNNRELWISTNDYLYYIKDGHNRQIYNNLVSDTRGSSRRVFSIKDMIVDNKGRLLMGESKGLTVVDNMKVIYNSFINQNIELRIESIAEIYNNYFFLGTNNGLWSYNNHIFKDFSIKNKLLSSRFTDILYASGLQKSFLGTKGSGLLVFDLKDSVVQITKSHGLSSNSVSSLLLLGNNLWVATNYGLNVFDVTKIGKKDFRIKSYFKNNGLVSNEINQIAGDDNNIYIATNQGLTVFNYKNYNPVLSSPPIYISAFSILKNDTVIRSGYKLRHYQNLITIKFVGISFREPENLRYKYRLSGMDTSWIFTGNREVEYAYLPPGEYKFEVLAVNSDGIISQKPAQIAFTVLPPFWKTWWFITLVILFIAALAYLYYLNRLKQLKKEHSLKNDLEWYRQQALAKQMEPHFVFNTLNSIQSFIIRNDRLSSTQYLSKFARLMRLILTSSQKQAVPLSDEISAITLYLELEALRFQRRFDFNINVDSTVDSTNCLIPAFLIQPFVENAIWHGIIGLKDNGRIDLSFSKYGNHITCIVEDNGIGRVKAAESRKAEKAKRESFGISLVESRLNLLNNLYDIDMKVEIIDLYNENNVPAGTRVMIDLPLFS
ncbi:MAG: histidine kinase [Bacteroidales bacterium]|nr:histidine kinase [Bacteroidales bacterium]